MMRKFFTIIFLLTVIGVCVYVSWIPLQNIKADMLEKYFPCQLSISYSIGEFDPRFGISQADFLNDLSQAAAVWGNPINKKLFVYDPHGSLKINLIYDYRQEAMNTLIKLGTTIDASEVEYNMLKAKYTTMQASYVAKTATLNTLIAEYHKTGQGYGQVQQVQNAVNAEAKDINLLVVQLNNIASKMNISVDTFNTIGQSTGQEFNEALYVQDGSGDHIDVYEFASNDKLVHVLAHELGHALGFVHTANTDDIMYKVNQSMNIIPTANDLAQLKGKCNIK